MIPQTKVTLKLTSEDTRQEALERLVAYFPLRVSGYECTAETVFDVLIKAAVTGQTIETVCNDLEPPLNGVSPDIDYAVAYPRPPIHNYVTRHDESQAKTKVGMFPSILQTLATTYTVLSPMPDRRPPSSQSILGN